MYTRLVVLLFALAAAAAPIYDPYFVFCGSNQNCYDILQIRRNATSKQIRRAYRRLSLEFHPDKSKHANATEAFRLISKAYEVLDGNETRKSFDYYLDHPKDYFKVSGHHYMRQLPKSNVILVLIFASLIVSALLFWQQTQKYESFVKRLKAMVMECALNGGKGNKQTTALFNKCAEMYEVKKKEVAKEESWAASTDSKKAVNPKKMVTEKLFEDCVDAVVAQVRSCGRRASICRSRVTSNVRPSTGEDRGRVPQARVARRRLPGAGKVSTRLEAAWPFGGAPVDTHSTPPHSTPPHSTPPLLPLPPTSSAYRCCAVPSACTSGPRRTTADTCPARSCRRRSGCRWPRRPWARARGRTSRTLSASNSSRRRCVAARWPGADTCTHS